MSHPVCSLDTRATPIDRSETGGAIYELGGHEVKSFKELMQLTLATIGRRRLLMPISFGAARLTASFMQLPTWLLGLKPMLTPDQVDLLTRDNVVSDEAARDGRTLPGLGIAPTAMGAVVPTYLWRFRKSGQFANLRTDDGPQATA